MIPIIDFTLCNIEKESFDLLEQDIKKLGAEIVEAFRNVGFVYLVNHGLSPQKVNAAKEASKQFFLLPNAVKEKYARAGNDSNFGYVGVEIESLNPDRPADLKEAFNMTPREKKQNWPDAELPEFGNAITELFSACLVMSNRILKAIGHGLALKDPDLFVKSHSEMMTKNATTLRTLYYPPLPPAKDIKPNQIRCGEHSDYGSITLLFQDAVGGLEVKCSNGDYVPATPIEGAILVNVGDLLQRWTSDVLVSTKHRVIVPEEEIKRQEGRQSLAFFVHPDDDALIECIDGSNKYEPITADAYLKQRFAATYK